jgi:multidrug efflux pump subunit AcrB
MAKNGIAANVMMLILVVGGLATLSSSIKQEVFPEVDLDEIMVVVPYPGASPEEVEQGVVLALEEAVQGIDGVKEVLSEATEGAAQVKIKLLLGTDKRRALSDTKSEVDRITSFPADAERPTVSLLSNRQQVMSLVLYGDVEEAVLRTVAEGARRNLLLDNRITNVELAGVRPPEISIDVPQANLRKYGLTLSEIAGRIRAASVELGGGSLQTEGGEVLLRTSERRETGQAFADIVILSRPDGSRVRVRDIAQVRDGFRENHQKATFNGKPAAMIHVFRVGDQTPLEMAAAVKEHAARLEKHLPAAVSVASWVDRSEMYEGRIDLLLENAAIGLLLVLLILGLFLQARLAFWVTLGIPISFAGSLLLFPMANVSINMLSLFGFILALGMVVDDAIVVGEAIYKQRADGKPRLDAAIGGVTEVAKPVIFSVLTTCVAFMPMLFVPGVAGKFFRVVPVVVIAVLMMSLVESLLVLPAHLSHTMPWWLRFILFPYLWLMERLLKLNIPRRLERHIRHFYSPILAKALTWRYFTVAAAVAFLVLTVGFAIGRIPITFLPEIEGDLVALELRMYSGTPASETDRITRQVAAAASEILEAERPNSKDMKGVSRGLFTQTGFTLSTGPDMTRKDGGHLSMVQAYLVDSEDRDITTVEFVRKWRKAVGEIPGIESMVFAYGDGINAGQPIHIELMHDDLETLHAAAQRLADELGSYSGLGDIESGVMRGKEQLDFHLTDAGLAQGLTELELARQVRSAFFGAEAVRQQRGRDEVRTYVRLPVEERRSLYNVEQLVVRTPAGGEIPVEQAAIVNRGQAYTVIHRSNGRRSIGVTAGLADKSANAGTIMASIRENELVELIADVPGLDYRLGGELERQADAMGSLIVGFALALIVMLSILAVAFRSYLQPLLVMSAIPFGVIGAVWGHALMGLDISLISLMGIVALSGVVCNDSLILIDAININREAGMPLVSSVVQGCARRFRPVLLTSLTTFFGLAPMIMETSVQALFLVPMAVSLGFGILGATFIMLIIVPCCYMIMEDMLARGESYIGAHVKDRPTFIPPRLTITQVRIHDSSAGDAPKQPAQ